MDHDGASEASQDHVARAPPEAAVASPPRRSSRVLFAALFALVVAFGAVALLGSDEVRRALAGPRTCEELCPGGVLVLRNECNSGLLGCGGETWPDRERIERDREQALAQGCACVLQVKASFCGHCGKGE